MAQYDIEQLVRNVVTVFKAGLNTEIAAVNSDKGDFAIDTINDNAWYIAGVPSSFDYKQFVFLGVSDIQTTSVNVAEGDTVTIQIEVIVPDSGNSNTEAILYRLLRYQRALRRVAQKNFDKLSKGHLKIEVTGLVPASDTLFKKTVYASGIAIKASFSSI